MSFSIARLGISERIQHVRSLLSHIKTQESTFVPPTDGEEVKILRGLFYVHLYGAFEKSISEGVEQYLQQIADLQIPHAHFIPQFFPTALDALFTSLQSDSKRLKKRVDFVKKMASTDLCRINNSLFSAQLQNAWPETLT